MQFEQHIPAAALQPYIKTYSIVESEDGMTNHILPDVSLSIAFRLKGSISYEEQGVTTVLPSAVFSGLRKSSRLLHYNQQTATLLVLFKPGGAAALFHEPLHELFGRSISLDTFISASKIKQLEAQLAEVTDNKQRIAIVEQFLLSKLKIPQPDLLVLDAMQQIQVAKGDIKIHQLVRGLHISQDPFEKRFRKLTGTSPKQFSSIIRMRHIIATHSRKKSLTDAALSAGYFDQSHFIKDFRSFTGKTPQDFFKTRRYW